MSPPSTFQLRANLGLLLVSDGWTTLEVVPEVGHLIAEDLSEENSPV